MLRNTRSKRDMTEGPIFFRMLAFAIPIMMTGLLQVLYNVSDNIVVGKYSGDPNALAAVGSTASLYNLVVNFLIGISAGAGVVIAQFYGAKKENEVSKAVHTALTFSVIGGLVIGTVGVIFANTFLKLMGTNPIVLDSATLYLTIIFIGVPANSVYNFGSTIIRATGDSRTPLIILSTTGLINVLLNLVFVIKFGLGVAGVAIATIVAQYLSAISVIIILLRSNECFGLHMRELGIDKRIMGNILRIGVPSGLQSTLFSLSNVTIQSAVNTFPVETINGNTVGSQIESFCYTAMNSFHHTTVTFTGQNYGAKKMKRVYKVLFYAAVQVTVAGLSIAAVFLTFMHPLASLFTDGENAEAVIAAASARMWVILPVYFLCGMMDVLSGHLRGMGCSITPMISSLVGSCLLRILWIVFIFPLPAFNSPFGIYITYPISWSLTCIFHLITIFVFKFVNLKRSVEVSAV